MLFKLGFALLFFLPVIESLSRDVGFYLLVLSALLLFLSQLETRWLVSEKIKEKENDWISLLWILLLIAFAISTIFSGSFIRSCIELIRYIALFSIFDTIRNYPHKDGIIKKFFISTVLINNLILSVMNLAYLIPFVKIPIPASGMNLFYPSFGHNRIAEILIYALSLLIFMIISVYKWRIHLIILISFFTIFLLASSSRASMVVFIVCLLSVIFIKASLINKRKLVISSIFVFTSIVTMMLSLWLFSFIPGNSEMKKNAAYVLTRPLGVEYRVDYIQQAVKGVLSSPIIGNGPDTFVFISKIYSTLRAGWSDYAHNHYIQLFSDTGLLGGLIFIILNIVLFINPVKKLFKKQLTLIEIGILLGVTSSAVHSFFDFDWQFNSLFIIYLVGLGLLNHNYDNQITQRKNTKAGIPLTGLAILFFGVIVIFYFQYKNINLVNRNISSDQNLSIPVLKQIFVFNRLDYRLPDLLFVKYRDLKDYQNAHLWNQKTILLSGFHGESVMKRDYLLYLSQARSALDEKNLTKANNYLSRAFSMYPFFPEKSDGPKNIIEATNYLSGGEESEAIKVLYRFIDLSQLKINDLFLDDWQILYIIEKLRLQQPIVY